MSRLFLQLFNLKSSFIPLLLSIGLIVHLNSCASSGQWGKISSGTFNPDSIQISDKTIPARVLFDIGNMRLNRENFTLSMERYVRIQIFRDAGKKYADVRIPFYRDEKVSSIKAQTILPSGEIVKLKRKQIYTEGEKNGWRYKVFAIPGVQNNCIVEYRYSFSTPYMSVLDPWKFQRDIPTKLSRVSMLVPTGFRYQSFIRNSPDASYKPVRQKVISPNKKPLVRYTWEFHNLPPVRKEPYISTVNDYISQLYFQLVSYQDQFNYFKFIENWTDLNKKLYEYYKPYLNGDRNAGKIARNIVEGESNPKSQIDLLYSFVRDSIETTRYHGVISDKLQSPQETFKKRQGSRVDKNLLLLALCKEMNIPANILVTSTRTHGEIYRQAPRLMAFNNVIVMVTLDNKRYFLDTRDPYCPVGILPADDITLQGFEVGSDSYRFIKIPKPNTISMYNVQTTLAHLDETDTLRVNQILRFEGYRNIKYRSLLANSDSQEKFVSDYITTDLNDVTIDSVEIINEDNVVLPLTIKVWYSIPQFAEIVGSNMYFSPALLQRITENPFQLENRSFPIEYGYPRVQHEVINFTFPKTCILKELPKDRDLEISGHKFYRRMKGENNTLKYERWLYISKTKIAARHYTSLKNFYAKIVQTDQDQVVASMQSRSE